MSHAKTLELAKKLKALADRGVGGEKVNAKNLLLKLLKNHGMTMADLESELEDYHYFHLKESNTPLFYQVTSTILGDNFKRYKDNSKPDSYCLFCTNAHAIEIQAKFDFFLALYVQELETFHKAFIIRQDLFPINVAPKDESTLSAKELEDYRRARDLSKGIKEGVFLKQLNKGDDNKSE